MSSIAETMLLFMIKQVLTQDVVKGAEKQLVVYLKQLAAQSTNRVDDYVVEVVAEALGVSLS